MPPSQVTDTQLWDTVDWAIRLLANELGYKRPERFGLAFTGQGTRSHMIRADTGRRDSSGPVYIENVCEGEPVVVPIGAWTLRLYGVHKRIARAALLLALVEVRALTDEEAGGIACKIHCAFYARFRTLLPKVRDVTRPRVQSPITLKSAAPAP